MLPSRSHHPPRSSAPTVASGALTNVRVGYAFRPVASWPQSHLAALPRGWRAIDAIVETEAGPAVLILYEGRSA
jgi:hypothetical protein